MFLHCEHLAASAAQFCSVLCPWLHLLLEKSSLEEVSTLYSLGFLLRIDLPGIIISLGVSCEGDSIWLRNVSITPCLLLLNMLISSLIFYFLPSVCELSFGKRRKKCCYFRCRLCSAVGSPSMIPTQFIVNIVNYHHPSANPRRSYQGKKMTLDWCAAQMQSPN